MRSLKALLLAALPPMMLIASAAPAVASPASRPSAPAISVEVEVTHSVRLVRNAQPRPTIPASPGLSLRRTIPLPEIVAGLQAQHPYRSMSYIGVERFDPQRGIYALRFLDGRQVVVVVVDARTGRILDRGY